MNLSTPLSSRIGIFAAALLYTGLTFGVAVAPVEAKSQGPYYVAELAEPAKEARAVARGVAWRCEGTSCRAGKANSRPLRICRGLVREFGEVKSFSSKGKALPQDKLDKCNGK